MTRKRKGPKLRPNQPCPCGSGDKFKRCHGEAVPWIRAQRAYGRLDKRIEERKAVFHDEQNAVLPCKSNCFQCCRAPVLSTEAEGFAFVGHLIRTLSEDELLSLREKFEEWYETLVEAGLHEQVEAPRVYHGKKVWCPVLEDGKCSHYEMRPVICRTHYSLDVQDCENWISDETEGLKVLNTEDMLQKPVMEIGIGPMTSVSYWQFWVGKHLGCSFAEEKPPYLGDDN